MRVLFVAIAAACLASLAGCEASPPGRLETKTITYAKHHIFIRNKSQKNPLPDTPQTWTDGKEAFSHYCVACHGMDGQNTGVPFLLFRRLPPRKCRVTQMDS
jgi:cytochrome c553